VGLFGATVEPKKLELLHELVPKAVLIGVLVNPNSPTSETVSKEMEETAQTLGLQVRILKASTESEIDAAFATLLELHAGGLIVAAEPFFDSRREQFVLSSASSRPFGPRFSGRKRWLVMSSSHAMNAADPSRRPTLSAFRRRAAASSSAGPSQQIGGQQPLQMLLSMRSFCSRIARSSGVVPDDCGTPGRGTVSPVDVR